MSRSTFREKVDVCWQKQLRDKHLNEGTPDVPFLKVKSAIVRPISRAMAKQIIFKYEWLGTMSNTSIHYGIFFGDYCAGVTCVAVNGCGMAGAYGHRQFKIERIGLSTLARGACVHWAPSGSNSKLVSMTCKLLSKDFPKTKILTAYSDPDAGEIGTIYQACNWFYTGETRFGDPKAAQFVAPNGQILNRMCLRDYAKKNKVNTGEMKKILLENGWKGQAVTPKRRYVQIIDKTDKALLKLLQSMAKPYPKRTPVEVAA